MSQTTVFKAAGACTDTSRPILYRDPAASAGSLFCVDALDTYSWPSQAAPSGAATLVDLLDIASASIAATAMGWANGFVMDSADADAVTLPVSSKLASNVASFGIAIWLKFANISAGPKGVFGLADSSAATQYSIYRDGSQLLPRMNSAGMASINPVAAETVYQLGMATVLSGGNYTNTMWVNGVLRSTLTNAAPMNVPATTACIIGKIPYLGANGDDMTFFRAHADALTTRTAAEFMAADYAAGVGRFS